MVADGSAEAEAYATARRIAAGAPLVARWHKQFLRRLAPAADSANYLLDAYNAAPLGPLRPVGARLVLGHLEVEALSFRAQEPGASG